MFGSSWEISFSANGMNPPGLASVAPAAAIAIADEDAIPLICSIIRSARPGSGGRRAARATNASTAAPAATSTTATHVLGSAGVGRGGDVSDHERGQDADRERHTQRTDVEPQPVRSGRSPRTSASTVNDRVVGESIAPSVTRTSSTVTDVIHGLPSTAVTLEVGALRRSDPR